MSDTVITILQLFGIGFGFGIAGPCFLSCTPILITYIAGKIASRVEALRDISLFLIGRLSAYIALGVLAGLSGSLLRRFAGGAASYCLRPAAAVISILLGIFILFGDAGNTFLCRCSRSRYPNIGSLITLGFIMGVVPCAPLSALLLEITLMSKGVPDGIVYALSFGIGTSFSALIVVGGISGFLVWLPNIMSKTMQSVFRLACAALLILMGVMLLWR